MLQPVIPEYTNQTFEDLLIMLASFRIRTFSGFYPTLAAQTLSRKLGLDSHDGGIGSLLLLMCY